MQSSFRHPMYPTLDSIPDHLRCEKSPAGMHMYGIDGFTCMVCREESSDLKQKWQALRDKKVSVGASADYQARIQGVALQLLSQFMQANMIRDMGQVIRDTNTVKAPMALTEMLDMSLAGAIHFVNELSKLQPNPKYVDQFAQRFDVQPEHLQIVGA